MTQQTLDPMLASIANTFHVRPPVTVVTRGLNLTLRACDSQGRGIFIRLAPPERSLADVLAECSFVTAIRDTPCLNPLRPICDASGVAAREVELCDQTHVVTVYPEATGMPLSGARDTYILMGNALAELHAQSHATLPSGVSPISATVNLQRLSRNKFVSPSFVHQASSHLDLLRQRIDGNAFSTRTAPCHGDFRLANALQHEGRLQLFDWEACHVGLAWRDASRVAWWLEHQKSPEQASACWSEFLAGYDCNVAPDAIANVVAYHMCELELEALHAILLRHTVSSEIVAHMLHRATHLFDRATSGTLRVLP